MQGLLIYIYQYNVMKDKNKSTQGRPEAYPRPSSTDNQLKNQPEYIDEQPNDFEDKSVSDLPTNPNIERQSDDPGEDINPRGLA